MHTTTDHNLLRLLQLSSVSLPVGGFAFSQGLEYAVESGWVKDYGDTHDWLQAQIEQSLQQTDLTVLCHCHRAAVAVNAEQVDACNTLLLACRETSELRLTDTAMGESLQRLLRTLQVPEVPVTDSECSFVTAFAWAAAHWGIEEKSTLLGFGWSWLENQVAAATKLVPLGQSQAQQCLSELQPVLSVAVAAASEMELDQAGASLPALAVASCRHETQYTRLFRS